jgi:hypothetical protein
MDLFLFSLLTMGEQIFGQPGKKCLTTNPHSRYQFGGIGLEVIQGTYFSYTLPIPGLYQVYWYKSGLAG